MRMSRCSTLMEWHILGHVEDAYSKEENFDNPVKLIRFDVAQNSSASGDDISLIRHVYMDFDVSPLPMLRTSMEPLPSTVDVIVGHSMVSSSAAFSLRDQLYPNSKVRKKQSNKPVVDVARDAQCCVHTRDSSCRGQTHRWTHRWTDG